MDLKARSIPAGLAKRHKWTLAIVATGVIVAAGSLFLGADPSFVALQLLCFASAGPLVLFAARSSPLVAGVAIASFAKTFLISQMVALLFLRAPDAALGSPLTTVAAILTGMWGSICALMLVEVFRRCWKRQPLVEINVELRTLRSVALFAAVIGLPSQVIWSILTAGLGGAQGEGGAGLPAGLALFVFLAPLAMLSVAAYSAAKLIESRGRSIVSRPVLIVLGVFCMAVLPIGQKTGLLLPATTLFVVALTFRWRLSLLPTIAAALLVAIVAQVVYPVVNISRLQAAVSREPLPAVLIAQLGNAIRDPGSLGRMTDESASYERAMGQTYYGHPTGFLDRFTPLMTDRLISGEPYAQRVGARIFSDAARALLPQTFGFRRDTTARQLELEQITRRTPRDAAGVSWDNTGFVADGYLAGGLAGVALVFFVFTILCGVAAQICFGSGPRNIAWMPIFVTIMFIPADATFQGMAPILVWRWAAYCVAAGAISWAVRKIIDRGGRNPRRALSSPR